MASWEYLNIFPEELKFSYEVMKPSSCAVLLSNQTSRYIAFRVKTNPKKFCVRPNAGVVLPNSTIGITVTMQAPKSAPSDMQCKDKFLIQSTVVKDGATVKDLSRDLFKENGVKVINELNLRAVYVPVNPLSPVPQVSEGSPPRALNDTPRTPSSMPQSAWSLISRLREENGSAILQDERLHLELEYTPNHLLFFGEMWSKDVAAGGLVLQFGILIGFAIKNGFPILPHPFFS